MEKSQVEQLLTIPEVAALLKVTKQTVRREIDAGRLGYVKVRRTIRIPASAYTSYLRDLSRR